MSNLKLNKPYFTEIYKTMFQASNDMKKGLDLLQNIEQPIVSIFGSHRPGPEDKYYKHAYELAYKLGQKNFAIITGGGPGIMFAANAGAKEAGASSIGFQSEGLAEMEPADKSILTDLEFTHFLFSRRFVMSIKSDAMVYYPGAYGTLTEMFENVALISAHLIDRVPIICVGREYWQGLIDWLLQQLIQNDFAHDPQDYIDIITIEDDVDKIVTKITNSIK
jgi:uncharacterized protein (TIGR00730 family)